MIKRAPRRHHKTTKESPRFEAFSLTRSAALQSGANLSTMPRSPTVPILIKSGQIHRMPARREIAVRVNRHQELALPRLYPRIEFFGAIDCTAILGRRIPVLRRRRTTIRWNRTDGAVIFAAQRNRGTSPGLHLFAAPSLEQSSADGRRAQLIRLGTLPSQRPRARTTSPAFRGVADSARNSRRRCCTAADAGAKAAFSSFRSSAAAGSPIIGSLVFTGV